RLPRALHSFPTRRSPIYFFALPPNADSATRARLQQFSNDLPFLLRHAGALGIVLDAGKEQDLLNMSGSPNRILPLPQVVVAHERSEEHTSELQSLAYLVC